MLNHSFFIKTEFLSIFILYFIVFYCLDINGKSESNIIDIIKDVSKYCTVIMIAHRINSIKNIDNIYVLKEGFILAKGTHEELLKKCGYYSSLVGKYK